MSVPAEHFPDKHPLPPIDAAAPAQVATATFALG
jgi:hypothetical protein